MSDHRAAEGARGPGRSSAGTGRAPGPLLVHEEVATALGEHRAVVALESSVFVQGLPHPLNREAAERMLAAVRAAGAVPAVTAVISGRACLGVTTDELEVLLRSENVAKLSARDLPFAAAQGVHGATTVAAALAIARAAGAQVFATGGIGGVHREPPYDESADLIELSRSSMVVVCAGAKAILDLSATFERLETLGVSVAGYRTSETPGFFTRTTGLPLPARLESVHQVATAFRRARALCLPGALLVLNPPPEAEALPAADVERAVDEALRSARAENVRGGALTPYLLAAVEGHTGGRSLAANLALLEHNARLAGEIAVAL